MSKALPRDKSREPGSQHRDGVSLDPCVGRVLDPAQVVCLRFRLVLPGDVPCTQPLGLARATRRNQPRSGGGRYAPPRVPVPNRLFGVFLRLSVNPTLAINREVRSSSLNLEVDDAADVEREILDGPISAHKSSEWGVFDGNAA